MAFVYRTTRETPPIGATAAPTDTLGPGSYDLPRAKLRPAPAPFNSTARRERSLDGATLVTPGPGTYGSGASSLSLRRSAASTAFKSRTTRFRDSADVGTPGPGAYSPVVSSPAAASRERRRRGGEEEGAVKWVRVPTAPSIPAASQSYGYEEGSHGELVLQKPLEAVTEADLGPGTYNPDTKAIARSRSAVAFGKSRSRRTDFSRAGGDAPGPGMYDSAVGSGASSLPKSKQLGSMFASKTKRDGMAGKIEEDTPGPGAYGTLSAIRTAVVPEERQFFGSTSRRFRPTKSSEAPGPGAYSRTGGRGGRAAAAAPIASVGFTSTASRFGGRRRKQATTPGAGSYSLPGMADAIGKKLSSRAGVFGSTTKRFTDRPRPSTDTGGSHRGHAGRRRRPLASSAPHRSRGKLLKSVGRKRKAAAPGFSSGLGRFVEKKRDAVPDPGQYTVTKPWVADDWRKRGLLASGPDRFRDSSARASGPGPGQYSTARSLLDTVPKHRRGLTTKSSRFGGKSRKEGVPGPGSYDTEYLYGNLNRKTFNITIAESSYL